MDYDMTNPYEIAKYIKEAKKATPVKVYVKGDLSGASAEGVKVFGQGDFDPHGRPRCRTGSAGQQKRRYR